MGCKHEMTTIVEDEREELGAFLNTQCDLCGVCLPNAPIPSDVFDAWFEGRLRLPHVDLEAYRRGLDALIREVFNETHDLETFAQVAKHG